MVDYVREIGGNTRLMIRDLGGPVEFWVQTGSSTWNNEQPWSFGANGGNSPMLYFRLLRGGFWQKMGETHVGYDQTIRFTIYNSGLGFPTHDFFQHIQRSTVPGAPYFISVSPISQTHIRVHFSGTHDGGSPVLEWQIGYGGNPNAPEALWGSNGLSDVGPFASGQKVYFWARGRNAIGWSPWSGRAEAFTWRVPDAPFPVTFENRQQTSVGAIFNDFGDGGVPIVERQIGYSLTPDDSDVIVPASSGLNNITGLEPGQTYYFWSRSRNSVGWSPWSGTGTVTLIAGAQICVGNQWLRAVPYVRVDGEWKVARPWVRDAGIWKETSV